MFIAKYFHITHEGAECYPGFNFYPWEERKYSIGFRLLAGPLVFRMRWRRKVLTPRLLVHAEWYSPEERCKTCARMLESGMVAVPREVALDAGIKC